jgi:O-antigen ligase
MRVSLDFSGNYSYLLGKNIGTIMEYASFLMQIAVMLLSSGDDLMDIRIVDLKRKYTVIYLFVGVVFAESMLVSAYPLAEAITCVRLVVTAFYVIWLVEQFSLEKILSLFGVAQLLFDAFTVLFLALMPDQAFESGSTYIHALRGFYPSKNTLAFELVFGVILLYLLLKNNIKERNSRIWIVALSLQIILLILCQATGALICAILVCGYLHFFGKIRFPLGWFYIASNIGFLFCALTILPLFEPLFEALGKDVTITGRTPLWNQIIQVMTENNTFTGFGFGMFWRDETAYVLVHRGFDADSFMGQMTTGAHNTILELWLNIGIIGIAAFFLLLIVSMRKIRELREDVYQFCSACILYLTLNGLTERTISNAYNYRVVAYFLVAVLALNRTGKEEKEWNLLQSSAS